MAIVNNTASEIGDQILIQATAPVFGVIRLESFDDDVAGETGSRFFKKEFSYSIDGIFFSDWILLTNDNLLQIIVQPDNSFYINYKYTRDGSDSNGLLTFNRVCVLGQFTEPICQNYFILPNSIFKDFYCNNPQHALLCATLTNKMFDKGILPEYITRNETENPAVDDKDFLDFWGTVCCFFALQLMLAKKLEHFDQFLDTLQDFLKQRDVLFCDDITELADLQYIKTHYYDEIRQRGTANIFEKKSIVKPVDGEFLRLICYQDICDEFFWEFITDQKIGWWLGNSSPMFKHTLFSPQLIKGKEKLKDFLTLSNYDTFTANGGQIDLVSEAGKNIARISNVSDGQKCGFAPNLNASSQDLSKALTIDENVDYEITFWIKTNVIANNISFGVMGYSCEGNEIFPRTTTTSGTSNFFFQKKKLNKVNNWYFVRGILYNKNIQQLSVNQSILEIGFGQKLKSFTDMTHIIPYLVLDREANPNASSRLDIWDFKVRPLVRGAVANTVYNDNSGVPKVGNTVSFGSFSTGFLTTSNIVHIGYENKNAKLSNDDIYNLTRHKLIPYDTVLVTTELTPKAPPIEVALREFDFLIIRYRWFDYSGSDMDTRTCIEGTIDPAVDNKYIGWSRGDIDGGRRYVGNILDPYIIWGGDNTSAFGEEQVLVNFKKVLEDHPLIVDVFARMRAFWYGSKNTGQIQIEFQTYLGGTMSQDGLGFKNTGGQSIDLVTHDTIVNLTRYQVPGAAVNIDGEDVGKIKYNKLTKQAILIV